MRHGPGNQIDAGHRYQEDGIEHDQSSLELLRGVPPTEDRDASQHRPVTIRFENKATKRSRRTRPNVPADKNNNAKNRSDIA
jgi:hypothetical protein